MTILEINESRAVLDEMRAEIEEKRAAGATHIVFEIEDATLLVQLALGVMQLDEFARKAGQTNKRKVQR